MPITRKLTLETVNFEDQVEVDAFDQQMIDAGMERVRAQRAQLRAMGLLDSDGHLLPGELPADMKPGSDRDVGG